MSKSLNDFVKDNSKFLKLADGETFKGSFVSYKVTASKFDPDKETVAYKLKCEDGREIYFQTRSTAVARVFAGFKGGEKIVIKRSGEGPNTQYAITSPDIQIDDDELHPDEDVQF